MRYKPVKMTILQEIAKVTSPISMRKLLSGSSRAKSGESLIYNLYKYLRKGTLSEEAIASKLYGKGIGVNDGRFKTLKSRLKKIMLESLINDEAVSGTYTDYDNAYMTGFRQLCLARVLIARRAYLAAKEVASNTFRQVKDYEIIPVNEGLTDILTALYLGVFNNKILFKKYQELHDYYAQALYDIQIVTNKYRIMKSKVYAHQDTPREIGRLSVKFTEEIRHIMEAYPKVSALQGMIRTTEITGLKLTGKYKEAIAAAEEANEVLLKCKGASGLTISTIALTQIECSLHLGDLEFGKKQVDRASKLIPKGTINAVKLSENTVLLGLYCGDYQYAYEEFNKVGPSDLAKLPNAQIAEVWVMLEAYIHFLVRAGRIKVDGGSEWAQKKFRVGKFMNEVPNYSANKQGMNIQILVLQALFFIVEEQFDKFIDRTDSLKRYCTRYLKGDDNLRHNCFFKLMLEVVKGEFRLASRKRRINEIYERMTGVEAQEISRQAHTEILPYEVLWEILVEHLPKHQVQSGQEKAKQHL